jgi:hypothetical protein
MTDKTYLSAVILADELIGGNVLEIGLTEERDASPWL